MGRHVGARLSRKDDVDGVLGQHRDEREHGDGQAGGDVELRGLSRPGEQKGGTDDGGTEGDGVARMAQRDRRHPHDDRRQRDRSGDGQ